MLKGLPKLLSPELVKVLCEMGHGDEIVIGDANFPAVTMGKRVIRADGISGTDMLDAILKCIPLDVFVDENLILMSVPEGTPTPEIWAKYDAVANKEDPNVRVGHLERFDFYDRAKNAYAVVATGEEAIYANIIIKKGVIK